MVIGDMISIEQNDEHPINFLHLGLLYCLDTDKDGRFCIDDLKTFAVEIMQKIKELTKAKLVHEIEKQVQAYCTLQLW